MNRFPFGFTALAAALLFVGTGPAAGQNAQSAAENRPTPIPASGSVPADPAVEERMLRQVTVPPGFDLTLFAGPPIAMYPTCVADSPDGAIYVCVDPNSSLSRLEGVGRVMRFVDNDEDGRADRYTTFLELDSPRGVVSDGETVYVMHPPTLSAHRDTNGDGIADWSRDIVTGLGFGLDFRGADHTTNQINLAPDGWIYVAVGDYGFQRAEGADGTEISYRGGAVVRVQPDGSNLEIYATGVRNVYDVAISPFLQVFGRDNTNDGEGWDTRLHYFAPGAYLGYPSRYKNFPDEHFPSLADYGRGAGVGALWLHDPAWPEGYRNTLLTADWTSNRIFTHPLTPRGSIYEAEQHDFINMLRPTDLVLDGRSHMYVSSLSGGQYRFAADSVGYVFRVRPTGVSTRVPQVAELGDAELVEVLSSGHMTHRTYAQREIVRRGAREGMLQRLEEMMLNREQPAYARVAAMLTYKELGGSAAHPAILRMVEAPEAEIRAVALRALADRKDQLEGVTPAVFVRALADPDDQVKIQAINGLIRIGAIEAADAIMPLTASDDQGLAHLAANAVARLEGREAALRTLDTGSPAAKAGAMRALEQMHDRAVVSALLERLSRAEDAATRQLLQDGLSRLHHREGRWTGDWWSTRPADFGPYYQPSAWEESPRIRAALRRALLDAEGAERARLANTLVRNQVLPRGAAPLVVAAAGSNDPRVEELIGTLVGLSEANEAAVDALAELNESAPALHGEIVGLLAVQANPPAGAMPLLHPAALDPSLSAEVRAQVLNAIGAAPGTPGTEVAAPIFAQLNPAGPGVDSPVDDAWRRWVGSNRRNQDLDYIIELTRSMVPEERVLAYAVLIQRIRPANTPDAIRERVTSVIDAALGMPAGARDLGQAVTIMGLESDYEERLRAVGAMSSQ